MITLLYHARSNGAICKRIAAASEGKIIAFCDKDLPILPKADGLLVRWDSKVEVEVGREINKAAAVALSRNKRASRLILDGLCPITWVDRGSCRYPCVVRPRRHFGGHKFFLCNNREELNRATRLCGGPQRWYASEFIEKTDEFRVFVLNGEAFKVVRRYRRDADPLVPWNAHNGGLSRRIKPEHWPVGVAEIAEEATKRLGLDLAAVDVISKDGKNYVLEANTAPGLEREGTIKRFAKLLVGLA